VGENMPCTSYLRQKELFHKKIQFLRQFKAFEKNFFCVQVQGVKNAPFEKYPG
jgi:hypothetical protein